MHEASVRVILSLWCIGLRQYPLLPDRWELAGRTLFLTCNFLTLERLSMELWGMVSSMRVISSSLLVPYQDRLGVIILCWDRSVQCGMYRICDGYLIPTLLQEVLTIRVQLCSNILSHQQIQNRYQILFPRGGSKTLFSLSKEPIAPTHLPPGKQMTPLEKTPMESLSLG